MPQPDFLISTKDATRFSCQVLGGSSWSQLICQPRSEEPSQLRWTHSVDASGIIYRPHVGKYMLSPHPISPPPRAQFNSQTEEIRAKCNYSTTLEAIRSKWKEHKRFLYLTLISRWRSHNVFTRGKKHRNICLWNDTEGEHVQGISRRRNFNGVRQQHRDHSRLFWHICCFNTVWMLTQLWPFVSLLLICSNTSRTTATTRTWQ